MHQFSLKPLFISLFSVFSIENLELSHANIDLLVKIVIGLLTILYYVKKLFYDK